MAEAEAALAAELLESRRKAEELAALLDAERKRAQDAELKLREKEKQLAIKNRESIDVDLVRRQRIAFTDDLASLKQHSQRFSNAATAVDVVIPGLQANAKTVSAQVAQHFAKVREMLKEREEKLLAVVESLASEKLRALQNQKSQMEAIVNECEKAITVTDEVLNGDDFALLSKREAVAAQIGHALANTCKLDAEWSEKLQATLPTAVEEIIETHGVISLVPIEEPENEWHKDLTVVSRIAEPPRQLVATRPSQGNSDFGFMFDIESKEHSVCIRALHIASGTGGGPWLYTVYTAPGNWKKIQSAKKKWLQVNKVELRLPSVGDTGAIRLGEDGIHIAAGQKQSFYIHSTAHMTAVAFTATPRGEDSKVLRDGATVDQDGHLRILTGAKTCSQVPFESVANDAVRAFAGSVEYVLWCES